MASLPSVVLGFLAALYFAPLVENWLAAFLSLFLTVPASFLLGAHAWQLLPAKTGRRLARYRFAFICLMLAPGLTASLVVGPVLDQWLFSGDVKGWLSRAHGSAAAGWIILLAPLAALVVCGFLGAVVNPFVRRLTASWNATACALASLAKFLAGVTATVALAYAIGWLLGGLGWDPRGDLPGVGAVVGTYVQRNALVVGFLMGFAIIPIIYTLSEDALSAVPEHLRSASLGCGATPWQTATRIIIPTAMSGLFSALMIGLGRAVGETMIVLMAAGNTPVMEMNIFNGFRTLSANIAVEMPEAVRDGTHYRSLYLAAMVLFAITFVVNTIAEAVRLRFRRRAFQL